MNAPLIERGLYTVADAGRLLRIPPQKIRGWIAGYSRTKQEPILRNEIGWLGGSLAFSFTNLMELRFIQHFSALKVRVSSIREMAREAEKILAHPHPLATKTVFQTDGRKIFARIAESENDPKLYDLQSRNWAMLEVIQQSLYDGMSYDATGDAESWLPRHKFPNIIVHPRIAFGQPALKDEGISTRVLYEAFQAEKDDFESVAKWYGLTADRVRDAVRFEINLAMAA